MAEPVKIVIVMNGDGIDTVLSCGLDVQFAVVRYPDKGDDYDDDDFFMVPQLDAAPVEAVGWTDAADTSHPAHALAMFDAVVTHHTPLHEPGCPANDGFGCRCGER